MIKGSNLVSGQNEEHVSHPPQLTSAFELRLHSFLRLQRQSENRQEHFNPWIGLSAEVDLIDIIKRKCP